MSIDIWGAMIISMEKTRKSGTTSPRLSREESQARTRERLIETATRLFVGQGYGGTSIRDIAEQAGYSQGAFYSNFESKESLLLEMLRRHMAGEAAHLATLSERAGASLETVLDNLEAWASTLDQDVNWSMLSIELQMQAQRSTTFATAYRAVWQQHRDALAVWLGQLFAAHGLQPPVGIEALAASFMALAHGLALQRASTGMDVSGRMMVVLLRGLLAMARPA